MIEGKTILVTGGGGSIGSELVRQLVPKNRVSILDINETAMFDLAEELGIEGRVGDVRDSSTLDDYDGFDLIFHCAALKHVTPNEEHPIEAVRTNILGTHNVIRAAQRMKARLINISTDKVVNGESIMGLTKKIAEKMVKNAGYVSVRFGNVVGSRGSIIPLWQKLIDEGKPLTVTDAKAERYMMTIPQACELIIHAAEVGQPGQILCMDMGKRINILALAKEIIANTGRDIPVKMIGLRKGETLLEELMTHEEESKSKKEGKFYVLE